MSSVLWFIATLSVTESLSIVLSGSSAANDSAITFVNGIVYRLALSAADDC